MKLVLSVHSAATHSPLSSVSNGVLRWLETGQTLIVGRSPQRAELSIPFDGMLSQVHFQIECGEHSCRLTDLKSTNGTRVNGQSVQTAELFDTDTIEAGQTTFNVSLPDGPYRPTSCTESPTQQNNHSSIVEIEPCAARRSDDESESHASTSVLFSGTTIEPMRSEPHVSTDSSIPSSEPIGLSPFDSDIDPNPAQACAPEAIVTADSPQATWIPDGWEIELANWPELELLDEIQQIHAEIDSVVEGRDYSATSVTISVYDPHQEAISPLASRAITWIAAGQSLVVGRSGHHADWALTHDHYLSSRHFRIVCERGRCLLENLSQTNGTWFQRQQVERAVLRDGDLIFAGRTTFQIGVQGGAPISDTEYQAEMILAK